VLKGLFVKIMNRMSSDNQVATSNLADMVRSWVHFDNLAATFTRQAQQARTARSRWEVQVLDYLKSNRMTNAIIQISGGRLTVNEEKHAHPLTLQRLESLLHDYFNQRPPGSTDETPDIMKFIRENRGGTIETKLKKS
jgi:hypothetical protein